MELIAYRFDCWPLQLPKIDIKDFDKGVEENAQKNFESRLEVLNSLFGSEEDVYYTLGDSLPLFKSKNDIILRSYKCQKAWMSPDQEEKYAKALREGKLKEAEAQKEPKGQKKYQKLPASRYDDTVPARIIYSNEGVYVIRIQKKRPLEGEDKNYHSIIYNENYVSSLVVLIIKEGRQYLFIENTKRTYAPSTVAKIFECTFNRLLMSKYHMMTAVNAILKLSDFWNTLNDIQQNGCRIKKLRFKFDYPNLPWPDDLLGGRFKRLGKDLNAETEIVIKGHHGQDLYLNTKEGERDQDINSMAQYCCDKGNVVYAYYDNRNYTTSCVTLGNQQSGKVPVQLSDYWTDVQNNGSSELFQEKYIQEILKKADEIKTMNA